MAQKNNLTIRVLSVIGGILTSIFLLGFLVASSIIRTETSALITGCIFLVATLAISRKLIAPFMDAMNITLYIAACSLIAYGFNRNIDAAFLALAAVGILTLFVSRGFILPFLSVILFIFSLIGELTYVYISPQPLQIAVIPVIGAFVLINLFEKKILTGLAGLKGDFVSKYAPFHFGLFVSCVCLLAALSIHYWIPVPSWLISVAIWIGILFIIQPVIQVMEVTNRRHRVGISVLCLLICLPTVFAPYLSGSLLLILICFHYGYKTQCSFALLLFIYAISKYYYDLRISLLVKSITLFCIGVACMAAWYYFTQKRTKHEKI